MAETTDARPPLLSVWIAGKPPVAWAIWRQHYHARARENRILHAKVRVAIIVQHGKVVPIAPPATVTFEVCGVQEPDQDRLPPDCKPLLDALQCPHRHKPAYRIKKRLALVHAADGTCPDAVLPRGDGPDSGYRFVYRFTRHPRHAQGVRITITKEGT